MKDLTVVSSAFRHGDMIPDAHTCDGGDVVPPLTVEGIPKQARSLAIIMDDPDSPHGTWLHWSLWDLDVERSAWVAGADLTKDGAVQGRTSWPDRRPGYYGPCPGTGTHRYFFRVFALDRRLGLPEGTDRATLEAAMDGHVLATGTLMGRYVKRANR